MADVDKSKLWSHSKFSCLIDCPLLFKFRYIDRRKTPKGSYLIVGTLVDRAFRNIVTLYPDSIENTDFSSLLTKIIEEENSKTPDFPFKFQYQNEFDEAVFTCKKCVSLYYGGLRAKRFTLPDPTPLDLGIKPLPGTDGHHVQGYIDASNVKENVILEYKTAAKAWSESQIYEHFQPDLYGWMRGTKPKYEVLIFTKEKKEDATVKHRASTKPKEEGSRLQVVQRPHDPRREAWMIEQYSRLVRTSDIMSSMNLWFPKNSWKCKDCFFKAECRNTKWGQSEFDYIDEKSGGVLTTIGEAAPIPMKSEEEIREQAPLKGVGEVELFHEDDEDGVFEGIPPQVLEMDEIKLNNPDSIPHGVNVPIPPQVEAQKPTENKIVPMTTDLKQLTYSPKIPVDTIIIGEKKKLLFGGF